MRCFAQRCESEKPVTILRSTAEQLSGEQKAVHESRDTRISADSINLSYHTANAGSAYSLDVLQRGPRLGWPFFSAREVIEGVSKLLLSSNKYRAAALHCAVHTFEMMPCRSGFVDLRGYEVMLG